MRIRCERCGLPIPEQPEKNTFDMLLCDRCYQIVENQVDMIGEGQDA